MKRVIKFIGFLISACAVPVLLWHGVSTADNTGRAEGRRLLEDGLHRAVAACYAAEGRYPESLAYLEEHYGIRADYTRYAVHYEIIARNLMPEITVIEK